MNGVEGINMKYKLEDITIKEFDKKFNASSANWRLYKID